MINIFSLPINAFLYVSLLISIVSKCCNSLFEKINADDFQLKIIMYYFIYNIIIGTFLV